jgi:hypothetical protein
MASMVDDPEIAQESEIYQAIKNDTVGIDEGDLNHLEAEEGEDAVEEDDDMLGDDDDDVDNDNEIPEGYGRDED